MKPATKRKSKSRSGTTRKAITKVYPQLLEDIVMLSSGSQIHPLCRRYGWGIGDVLEALQPLVASGRVYTDKEGRVFHRHSRRHLEQLKRDEAPKVRRSGSETKDSDLELARRITQNREAWVRNVTSSWNLLKQDPKAWQRRWRFHKKGFGVVVQPSLTHYNADPAVSAKIKRKASELLALYQAIEKAEREGAEIDPKALRPFEWPNVDAETLGKLVLNHSLDTDAHLLAEAGYHVGRQGLPVDERRQRLQALLGHSTSLELRGMPPYSCSRLRHIAYAIARQVWRARGKTHANMTEAIQHWKADLSWMKAAYYDGNCDPMDCAWPEGV